MEVKDMARIVDEYNRAIDSNAVEFVRDVLRLAQDKQNYKVVQRMDYNFGAVSKRETTDIISALKDANISNIPDCFDGFIHNLNGNQVEHINRRHGAKGKADHSMADIEDYGRFKYVIDNYDTIEVQRNQKGDIVRNSRFRNTDNTMPPVVVYKKRVNGVVRVVEAIPDSQRKQFQIISARKETPVKSGGAGSPVRASHGQSPDPVAERP